MVYVTLNEIEHYLNVINNFVAVDYEFQHLNSGCVPPSSRALLVVTVGPSVAELTIAGVPIRILEWRQRLGKRNVGRP